MSGPARAIPVLLGSLDAVVDVVDRGLMHQPCPRRGVEVLPASAGVPAVAHAATPRPPSVTLSGSSRGGHVLSTCTRPCGGFTRSGEHLLVLDHPETPPPQEPLGKQQPGVAKNARSVPALPRYLCEPEEDLPQLAVSFWQYLRVWTPAGIAFFRTSARRSAGEAKIPNPELGNEVQVSLGNGCDQAFPSRSLGTRNLAWRWVRSGVPKPELGNEEVSPGGGCDQAFPSRSLGTRCRYRLAMGAIRRSPAELGNEVQVSLGNGCDQAFPSRSLGTREVSPGGGGDQAFPGRSLGTRCRYRLAMGAIRRSQAGAWERGAGLAWRWVRSGVPKPELGNEGRI